MSKRTASSIHKQILKSGDKSLFLRKELENNFSQVKAMYLQKADSFLEFSEAIDQVVLTLQGDIENMDHEEINQRALIITMNLFAEGTIQFCNDSIEMASAVLKKTDLNEDDNSIDRQHS